MAIQSVAVGDGLVRSATFFDPSQDWTKSLWMQSLTQDPGAAHYQTAWLLGDPSYATPWLWMGVAHVAIGALAVQVDPGSGEVDQNGGVNIADAWRYLTLVYTAATTTLAFFVDGAQIVSDVVDLSAFTPVAEERLLTDVAAGSDPDLAVAYERVWQAALTATEILLERSSAVALRQTALLSDSPLTTSTDLDDISGNGHDWTVEGTVQTFSGSGPLPLTPNALLCATLTCNIPSCLPLTD